MKTDLKALTEAMAKGDSKAIWEMIQGPRCPLHGYGFRQKDCPTCQPAKATPGPWRVGNHPGDGSGTDWRTILSEAGPFAPSFVGTAKDADAELICRAVNSNADLLAALQRIATEQGNTLTTGSLEQALAAIAKAERGQS